LADSHAVGEQLRRSDEDDNVSSLKGWRGQVARLLGKSESTLNKALQFRRSYQADELPELERLGVGWSRLTVALAVKDKQKRHRLLKRAKQEGWDNRSLQRQLQQPRGGSRGGGRPRREPEGHGLVPDTAELVRLTEVWGDFFSKVWVASQKEYATEVGKMTVEGKKGVRRLLDEAADKVKELRRRCGEALEAVKLLRDELPTGE